jgi:serine/threonine protein kinase/tetratricopeptide (TPR) repeat protein
MIGRTLGQYRILERLGSGGMGVVWLAEDLKLGRRVALKTLRAEVAVSAEKRARFDREAHSVAQLNHPNVVTLYAFEEKDGVSFLSMEHVDGGSLDDLIRPGGMPLADVLRIGGEIAAGLAAAHERGIVHRDLKPGNVLFARDGRVKVVDFGLARALGGDSALRGSISGNTSLTQDGLAVGTLHYMSPEQLQNRPTDHRSDLFALGVVLYEMATGEMPFPGESAAQVISSMLRDPPRRLDDLDHRMPPQLTDLIAALLEKDVEARPQRAAAVRDEMQSFARLLDDETSAVSGYRPGTDTPRGRRRARRRRTGILTALGAAAAVIAGVVYQSARSEPPDKAALERTEPPLVVVLPLANFAGEPDYFVDGMTDGLIGALGRLGGVRVISRQSALHYKDSTLRLPDIATELGADYVVEGSFERAGGALRLQARLVRPEPEEQVWAEVFERPQEAALALHGEVAAGVARALRVPVSRAQQDRLVRVRDVDSDAYEAYLRGRHLIDFARPDTLETARDYLDEAIRLAPEFAPAYAGLAHVHGFLAYLYDDPDHHAGLQERYARQALELDPELAAAHAELGENRRHYHWDWEGAEAAIRRAVDLEPDNADARRMLWGQLMSLHRFEEARLEIEEAHRLDPVRPISETLLGLQKLYTGDTDSARPHFERELRLDPDFPFAHGGLWLIGDQTLEEPLRSSSMRACVAGLGFPEVAAEIDDLGPDVTYRERARLAGLRLEELSHSRRVPLGTAVHLLLGGGEVDRAEAAILRAFERRSPELAWLATNTTYAPLRDRPAILDVLDRMRLPRPEPRP